MCRFTVTLSSNSSMNYYEENAAAQFTTKLAQTMELDSDWEVGLSSIGVPAEVENAIAKECYCNHGLYGSISCRISHWPT